MKTGTFNKLISESFLNHNSITLFVRKNYKHEDERTQCSLIRSIRRYVEGSVVPSYSKARELLNALDIEISEQELMDMLDYSAIKKNTEIRYREPSFISALTIKYNELFQDRKLSISDKDDLIKERINEICDKPNVKEYIIKLIENDLDNGTLNKK